MKLKALDPSLALRPDFGSGVSDRVKLLSNKKLSELSEGDIAFCLRQSVALTHVIPIALIQVAEQPLREVELYSGDLLVSFLQAAKNNALNTEQLAELREICSSALATVDTINESVVPVAAAFISDSDVT
jgi:hypothetical protein